MIYKINSRQNEKIKEVCKYDNAAYCKQTGCYKIEGFHLFELAKEANNLVEVFTLKEIKDLDESIKQYVVNEDVMKKISSSKTPQGIVAISKIKPEQDIKSDKILFLDDVSDPGNMGTIFRTALAFGYSDIVLTSNCCFPYSNKVIQSSQGSIFKLNIVKNLYLADLKQKGYKIYSTELRNSRSIEEVSIAPKHVLVLGNEAHGVSQNTHDLADERIRIDIKNIESLNVAIAGSIAMYVLANKKS